MFERKIPPIKIKLFPPGKKIVLNGEIYTVDHVHVRNEDLMIKFVELDKPVNADTIPEEWEEIDLNRK